MYYLGIPTTRGEKVVIYICYIYLILAGSCVTSDTRVSRDIHYNGNVIQERATVISRIAPTFIR